MAQDVLVLLYSEEVKNEPTEPLYTRGPAGAGTRP